MNPYQNLPEKHYWRLAIANKNMFDICELWDPKFNILPTDKIITYGSCFAQHIGKALAKRQYQWLIKEIAPFSFPKDASLKFNYGVFSTRTGNIYTTSLLRQWIDWALGEKEPPTEIWSQNSRCYDPFRPNIEPDGFCSKEEMLTSRNKTIKLFKAGILEADYLFFTMGLTESWFNRDGEYEYPMCPGTAAGNYNPKKHIFKNQSFADVLNNLKDAIEKIRKINSKIKILLTVSPVPLTATYSKEHVLVATMESKSILRSVAGHLARKMSYVDYFPSYEIINSAPFKGTFFESNLRSVNHVGVDFVMETFFNAIKNKFGSPSLPGDIKLATSVNNDPDDDDNVVCEEELLDAFG